MNGVPLRVPRMFPLAILIVVVLLALAGCHRSEDRLTQAAIERASHGRTDVDRDDRTARVRGSDGNLALRAGESLPLPSDFPADVYLPEGYAVNSVMDLQGVSVVNLSAPGELSSLFSAAREGMQAQGWTQMLSAQHSVDAAMLAFEKPADGTRRSATLSFNRHHGDDRVVMGVQLRQSQVH